MPDTPQKLLLSHWIVPYAAIGSDAQVSGSTPPHWPELPHLQRLLGRLTQLHNDCGDAYSLTPPHERAYAQALGLVDADQSPCADGQIPWAAWHAQVSDRACAWFTLCQWSAGMEQVTLQPPEVLNISEAESRALLEALRPWAQEDGIHLVFETPYRWRAEGPAFDNLPCASIDRVANRRVDAWLPDGKQTPHARPLLRLLNEAQMLFYTHPVNDERLARRQAAINGLWISGAGVWHGPAMTTPPTPQLEGTLRDTVLRGNLQAWTQAWVALDNTLMADLLHQVERGDAIQLTLCGERHAHTWTTPAAPTSLPWWARLAQRLQPLRLPDVPSLLSQL